MKHRNFAGVCLIIFFYTAAPTIFAQHAGPLPDRFETIQQNSVTSLDAAGNHLWIGPGLNRITEGDPDVFIPQSADSVFQGRGRVFSLQVDGNRILAGLGFNTEQEEESVQTAQGFYHSTDNGSTWQFIPFFLDDAPQSDDCTPGSVGTPCDIEFTYGGETYIRTRITVPQQSPPFEVDFKGDTILAAVWASGIIRSTDGGETWERLILPPSTASELVPGQTYRWTSQAGDQGTVERYDPRFDNNLLGFGLLIDESDRVWAGTAGGINISENALSAPVDEIEWNRVSADGRADGLLGNWVVNIREQPETGRVWMSNWNASGSEDDRFGLVSTDDGGETFQHYLEGERINDIGFHNGTVFAAADNGLFLSGDDGETWRRIDQIRSSNQFIRKDADYFALASTDTQLWVGTSDGLAGTADGGQTWSILRVDLPLSGGNIYQEDSPDVETYAYPNPYSPGVHNVVRIKYEADSPGSTRLRIFDFGMNLVYEEQSEAASQAGTYEFSWDGTDPSDRVAATGPYFYVIDTPDGRVDGKILLID
ncbi:MAG: FlgD immunoglobulin-like domain containing protein [Bacteroidota bacterium]